MVVKSMQYSSIRLESKTEIIILLVARSITAASICAATEGFRCVGHAYTIHNNNGHNNYIK